MQSPPVEFRDGVFYVVLDAVTPHGRGVQHGLALRLPIRRTLAQFKRWIRNEVGLDDPDSINFDGFKQLFTTRPVLVHPGKPTGRTRLSQPLPVGPI